MKSEIVGVSGSPVKNSNTDRLIKAIIKGNPPCLSCGVGETCEFSTLPHLYGKGVKVRPDLFSRVEDQPELWQKAEQLGQDIAHRLGTMNGNRPVRKAFL